MLNGLQESAGTFGSVARTCYITKTQCIPDFNHLEIAATEGLNRSDRTMHPLLERQKDIFIGICYLLGIIPDSIRVDTFYFGLEMEELFMAGCRNGWQSGSRFGSYKARACWLGSNRL
jgi:hypothetical protein